MNASTYGKTGSPAPHGVDDAVGVGGRKWYAAVVNHNAERSSATKLGAEGFECFAASQTEMRQWRNGRKSLVERIVIPSIIFVRCTERQRLTIVQRPYIFRFLTDKASGNDAGRGRVAVIPDIQIERLRFMLGNSDTPVEVSSAPLEPGRRVRVVRGSLRGLEGEIISTPDGKDELYVRLDLLGCARLTIDRLDVEVL